MLAPTRELANQINDVLMPLAQMYGMTTTTVYGGVRYARQIRDLRPAPISSSHARAVLRTCSNSMR